jgi:pSer/pThr/pTyr-binding forkhead associated (FHA) protein
MSAKLLCLKGPYAGQEFPIEERGVVLGRDPETAGIVLDASFVSRSHANIFLAPDGRVVLQDLRSTNGTFLIDQDGGKTRVEGDAILADGQRFSLSANDEAVFEVQGLGEADRTAENDGSEVTRTYSGAPEGHAPAAQETFPSVPPVPGGVSMRGTSNVPLILGIVGSVLMIPGVFCSACTGGLISLSGTGVAWGFFIGLLPVVCGSVGAAMGKSKPTHSFIFLLIASIITGVDWFSSFFTDLLSLAALILYIVGAIVALTQKKEPATLG